MKSLPLLVLLALPAAAIETRWTATGTVSSVTGTGLTAGVGAPVSVKFSYDSGATLSAPFNLSNYSVYRYFGPVKLKMEVTIGESTWSLLLPETPPLTSETVVHAEAQNGPTDILRVLGSTVNEASFPSFPYTGSATARSIMVELRDSHSPSLFLPTQEFPDDICKPSSLSTATGEIKAGTDSIKFNIDLASVTVETGTPFKVALERTATGVRLRWPTEANVSYFLYESDDCDDWQFSDSYVGDGQEKVVEIDDAFAEFPLRRFYRVESQ